jgi:hypothetical protein
MLVSRPVAMRSRTSTVGTLLPRSTSESMLRLTPVRDSRSPSDSRRRNRSRRRRAPRPTMSRPDESRTARRPRSTMEDIILYGGTGRRALTERVDQKAIGGSAGSPRFVQGRRRAAAGGLQP